MTSPEMGPREPEPEEEIPQQNLEDGHVKQEAVDLGEKLLKRTLRERVVSEYQTRKPKKPTVEIDSSRFLERGAAFRFERGQIYKGYKILRAEIRDAEKKGEDATSKRELLKEMRGRAKVMEKDLDELNRQFHENVRNIDVETEFGNFSIPVVELDLKKEASPEPEDDKRTPYFFLGSIATNFHQSACFSMAMALDGHKVYVPMQPEQPAVKKPDNFGETLREQGNLKPYAKLAKGIIEKMGLKDFNLVGYSMGASTSLELAIDPELQGLNDLTIIEPLGIEKKGFLRLATEGGLNHTILQTVPSSGARIKTFFQGAEAGQGNLGLLLLAVNILSKKHFDPDRLKELKPKGRFQVFIGTKSAYVKQRVAEKVFTETEQLRQAQNPDASPIEFYEVENGDHNWPMMNALGLSKMITGEKPKERITKVKTKDLKNSVMAEIIKDIK